MHDDRELERKFASILPCLDQRQRRLLAAAEARSWGSGGIRRVSRASGISHAAFQRAWKALDAPPPPAGRIRRPGGGRQQIRATTPAIRDTLEQGIAPETRGDPRSPRRWTGTSTRQLAAALAQRGCSLSPRVVGELLPSLGDSLQAMAMTLEGRRPPDRDAPVRSINEVSGRSLAAGLPVIAVDPQKKELVGRSANGGREGRPVGDPEEGNTPAFPDPRIGKAIPYGIADRGWDLGGATAVSITTRAAAPSRASASGGPAWGRSGTPMRVDG